MKTYLASRLATMLWPRLTARELRPASVNTTNSSPAPLPTKSPDGCEHETAEDGEHITPAPDKPHPLASVPIDRKQPESPLSKTDEDGKAFSPPSPVEHSSQEQTSPEAASAITRLSDELSSLKALITSGSRQAQTICDQAESLKSISQAMRTAENDHVWERFLKAIFMEIILIVDDLSKARSALASGNADTASQILSGVEIQINQLLARHDITPMLATPEVFDPTCQKVVGVRTVAPVKAGMIESRPRRGYRHKNRVLRYEEVVNINPVKEQE